MLTNTMLPCALQAWAARAMQHTGTSWRQTQQVSIPDRVQVFTCGTVWRPVGGSLPAAVRADHSICCCCLRWCGGVLLLQLLRELLQWCDLKFTQQVCDAVCSIAVPATQNSMLCVCANEAAMPVHSIQTAFGAPAAGV